MPQLDFSNRVAIVTGAGGGLGRAYAHDLAARGAALLINDLGTTMDGAGQSASFADSVAEEIRAAGGRAIANYDSVASREGGAAIVEAALGAFGRVDVLVNSAGTIRNMPFANSTDADIEHLIGVHLLGAINVAQPAINVMRASGYGRIVFITSGAGLFGGPGQSLYGAAKTGLIGLMNCIALENKDAGVTVNAVAPIALTRMAGQRKPDGVPSTNTMMDRMRDVFGASTEPEFVAPLVTYLASEACTSTAGIYSAAGGKFSRIFLGLTPGWRGPRNKPARAEDVLSHFEEIESAEGYKVPRSLKEELDIAMNG